MTHDKHGTIAALEAISRPVTPRELIVAMAQMQARERERMKAREEFEKEAC